MKVRRKRYQKGARFYSVFQVQLDNDEKAAFIRANLGSFKIQRHAGSIIGNSLTSVGVSNALQAQVSRLKNRWSVALSRTTGWIFADIVIIYLRLLRDLLGFFIKVFFGSRQTFGRMISGVKYSAKRIEDIKEIETFVFISIAAAHQALKYAIDINRDDLFQGDDYKIEIPGLTFAGATTISESSQDMDTDAILSELSDDLDIDVVEDFVVDMPEIT